MAEALDLAPVAAAVERHGRAPGALIPILLDLQHAYRWLPPAALQRVGDLTGISPAAVAGVSTFYDRFRHLPAGRHLINVCHGTACHVKGAERIDDALRRHLKLGPGQDTDAEGLFTVQRVACLGCCTLAPVVEAGGGTWGHLTPERVPRMLAEVVARSARPVDAVAPRTADGAIEFRIGCGSCCVANGAATARQALERELAASGAAARVTAVGCVGACHRTPMITVAGLDDRVYARVGPAEAVAIARRHAPARGLGGRLRRATARLVDRFAGTPPEPLIARSAVAVRDTALAGFLGPQVRLATAGCGEVEPLDLDAWLARGAFAGLRRALAMAPEAVVAEVGAAGLRGRGGAGFPTARKWTAARAAGGAPVLIANGDEGDPGAFMDRMLLESFPFRVLEGMAIAAAAIGAREGLLYIRAEYPLALERVRAALAILACRGWPGHPSPPALRVVEGAGAFVCGEETALIAAVEGGRGTPRLRPPFPAERGLDGRPTVVNNIETLALLPAILERGAAAFSGHGTRGSPGTKVFALAGKVARGGLIEVPMGISLRRIVEEIGGGTADGSPFKAVQIGGPSGGCIPASLADLPVDYEALTKAGAIMGSGGLVVLDRRNCMVDLARYFLRFTQEQSCGKCTFCRIGTRRLLDLLDGLCAGRGRPGDLDELESLARTVRIGSLCGLGQTAPNPVLSTLRHFRDEYEAHLAGRCPAGRCSALVHYRVTDACTGCTKCAQACPTQAIAAVPHRRHAVDDARCVRCDACRTVCPVAAVEVV